MKLTAKFASGQAVLRAMRWLIKNQSGDAVSNKASP
jgi:hypothetical protein